MGNRKRRYKARTRWCSDMKKITVKMWRLKARDEEERRRVIEHIKVLCEATEKNHMELEEDAEIT